MGEIVVLIGDFVKNVLLSINYLMFWFPVYDDIFLIYEYVVLKHYHTAGGCEY